MTAKRIFPILSRRGDRPYERPRCCARVIVNTQHEIAWRQDRYGGEWNRCTFPATVEIDGREFCSRHGGEFALSKLLGEESDL
jgi:hypothetical protein